MIVDLNYLGLEIFAMLMSCILVDFGFKTSSYVVKLYCHVKLQRHILIASFKFINWYKHFSLRKLV